MPLKRKPPIANNKRVSRDKRRGRMRSGRSKRGASAWAPIWPAAQSNVDLARGSPVEAAAKIAERAHRDHLTALHGGEVSAWHHKAEAVNARVRGRAALQGAIIGAGMSLLGEASKETWFGGNPRRSSQAGSRTFIVPYHGL